jgi:serine/threonine-protein kinase
MALRRYEIGGLIAQGGMAEIRAACAVSEPGVSKRVALKRIRTDRSADPVFLANFFDEARLAVQLSHANVVQVFDFGRTEDDEFFLAMEFVEGVDLQRLRRTAGNQALSPAEALHLVAQALRGLDYAHRRADAAGQPLGIVHLDVKPANLLLSFEGEVKLTDFGVARSRDARSPSIGICGTIPFMSPEQARGDRVDTRSDVFSAGVVLSTLLCGAAPFGDGDTERTLERVRHARHQGPAPAALAELEPLLSRALAPDPERRFPTAGSFADALEEWLYARGLRGGATLLQERLRRSFPGERERLNALFEPGARSLGLEVARPASEREGTLLSRVARVDGPRRETLVAVEPPRTRLRAVVAGGAAVLALAGVGAFMGLRPSAGKGDDAGRAAAQSVAEWIALITPDAAVPAVVDPGAGASPLPPAAALAPADPAPDPKPAKPAIAMGMLTVNANPWGTVYVNGALAGTTPLLNRPVRAGPATVVVENPKLGRKVIQVRILPRRDTAVIVDLRSREEPR